MGQRPSSDAAIDMRSTFTSMSPGSFDVVSK